MHLRFVDFVFSKKHRHWVDIDLGFAFHVQGCVASGCQVIKHVLEHAIQAPGPHHPFDMTLQGLILDSECHELSGIQLSVSTVVWDLTLLSTFACLFVASRSPFEAPESCSSPRLAMKTRQSVEVGKLRLSVVSLDVAGQGEHSRMASLQDESSDVLATNDQQE